MLFSIWKLYNTFVAEWFLKDILYNRSYFGFQGVFQDAETSLKSLKQGLLRLTEPK